MFRFLAVGDRLHGAIPGDRIGNGLDHPRGERHGLPLTSKGPRRLSCECDIDFEEAEHGVFVFEQTAEIDCSEAGFGQTDHLVAFFSHVISPSASIHGSFCLSSAPNASS